MTLVDAKNLLERLRQGEAEDDDSAEQGEVDEAFQQIMFSDKIVINKASTKKLSACLFATALCRLRPTQWSITVLMETLAGSDREQWRSRKYHIQLGCGE